MKNKTLLLNPENEKTNIPHHFLEQLVQLAEGLGASRAAIIPADNISAEEKLATLCHTPGCENYGQSLSCPPNVSGPSWFNHFLKNKQTAIVIRIDLPSSVLFSEQRREVYQLLHEIVSGLEKAAVSMGFVDAKAFAGGSCKKVFCCDRAVCRVISRNGDCRHPGTARPSMSGFGINVGKLMSAAGWDARLNQQKTARDPDAMSWVAGLVVIG